MILFARPQVWWILAFVGMALFPTHARSQTPASRPATSQPTTQATSQPTPQRITITLNAQGQVHIGKTPVSTTQMLRQFQAWKQKNPRPQIQLQMATRTPVARYILVTDLLRDAGLTWKRARPTPRVIPSKRSKTSVPPTTRPSPGPSPLNWEKVPIKTVAGAKTPLRLEVRGWLRQPKGEANKKLFTALVRWHENKRVPLTRVTTNAQGHFRYRFTPKPGATYRIAVLHEGKFLQYPIPLQQRQGRLLYLRILLPKVKLQRLTWTTAPLIKTPGATLANGFEIRLELRQGGKPLLVATGLLRRKGKKRTPLGRAQTNAKGRLRYFTQRMPGAIYELAILHNNNLVMRRIPTPKPNQKSVVLRVDLRGKAAPSLVFEGLNFLVEPIPKQQELLRVTHFVSILFQPNGNKTKLQPLLPIAPTTAQIQIGKELQKLKIRREDKGIRILTPLKAGRNRFTYAYVVRVVKGKSQLDLLCTHDAQQIGIFLHPSLKLLSPKKKLAPIDLSQQKGAKRRFMMVRLGPTKANTALKFILQNPAFRRLDSFLHRIQKMKQDPNQRKKLYGIAVLFVTSFLGIFFFLLSPARTPKSNP